MVWILGERLVQLDEPFQRDFPSASLGTIKRWANRFGSLASAQSNEASA
jgi:hypothetical protein